MSQNYVLVTDSACDLGIERAREWGVEMIRMPFLFTDDGVGHSDLDQPLHEFYTQMRDGRVAKTSAVNEDMYFRTFTPILEQGKDILYLAFSSGLSVTAENSRKVAAALSEQYPERTIRVIDSLGASGGEGLFVYLAKQNLDAGLTLEENAKKLEAEVHHVCHWFTVEELKYLKRGGRISTATALLGTALNVKPVLHVDDEGHLVKMSQTHGRKKSIRLMAEHLGETIRDGSPIIISHADCLKDAELLVKILKEEYGRDTTLITEIGSVIGAHAGPGTLALFFLGSHR
ncbi:MAG: DegV family protein [Clostridiales bacterium]|nr:DegV family protein [Clostridiales bacterium]